MTGLQFVILGYSIAVVALWGYALNLWVQSRRLSRIESTTRTDEGARS